MKIAIVGLITVTVVAFDAQAQEQSVVEPDAAIPLNLQSLKTEILSDKTTVLDLSGGQHGVTETRSVFTSEHQVVSVFGNYDPFNNLSEQLGFHFNEVANSAISGVNYQFVSDFGVASMQLSVDSNEVGQGQLLDISYGYPFMFAEQRGLVMLNLGADYVAFAQQNSVLMERAGNKVEDSINPYVSIDGVWLIDSHLQWKYNVKYQMSDSENSLTQTPLDEKQVIIYTGVKLTF